MESKISQKSWNKNLEASVIESWKTDSRYNFNENTNKQVFSIDTPPPYVNAPIHIGHATTYALMDFFTRYHRMKGDEVLFPLGLDRNGLPIEMGAEKKFNIRAFEVPRQKFLEYCEEMLAGFSDTTIESFFKLGIRFSGAKLGGNIGDMYYTDSPEYRTLTQSTFIDMYNKGLIYEASRVNNFDPGTRTTIADAEIDYVDKESTFNDIVFTCKETGEKLIIGTTRPELVCTCGMVIFNPEDTRYAHLNGKTALTAIYHKEVPIRSHPFAKMDKGTGLVMMCLAGDYTDILFFREQGLKQKVAIGTDAKMNEVAGFLQGLPVKKAREAMIEELQKKGLLAGQKKIMHSTPISERSKQEIEFVELPELYVKQMEFKENVRKIADQINFYSIESKKILTDWIDSVSIDWPITRKRYYATEVPLWYCTKCNHAQLGPKGKYVRPWCEEPPIKECPKCANNTWKGDERVLDTWFDSAVSALYILGYERKPAFYNKHQVCTLRPQGKEIVRTWLYYTLLKCFQLTGKAIFSDVYIHQHILDEKGIKMSKSLGNVIDPLKMHERFGCESFRLWAASEGNLEKTDFRCSFERIESQGKTINKLWNVARFISQFNEPPNFDPKQVKNQLDCWMISETDELIKRCDDNYAKYDFFNPVMTAKNFLWETFASHYVELVKARAYNAEGHFTKEEQESAIGTLYYCLKQWLLIMAPVLPVATELLYKELTSQIIHFEKFPSPIGVKSSLNGKLLAECNSNIWKMKKEKSLSLNAPIQKVVLPEELSNIEKDFQSCHKIEKVEMGKEFSLQS